MRGDSRREQERGKEAALCHELHHFAVVSPLGVDQDGVRTYATKEMTRWQIGQG